MLANFSQEEFVLPKATVMGVAEHISPSVLAAISDNDGPSNPPMTSAEKMDVQMFTLVREVKFKKDLGSTFGLLSKRERTVMEPVLKKIHERISRRRR